MEDVTLYFPALSPDGGTTDISQDLNQTLVMWSNMEGGGKYCHCMLWFTLSFRLFSLYIPPSKWGLRTPNHLLRLMKRPSNEVRLSERYSTIKVVVNCQRVWFSVDCDGLVDMTELYRAILWYDLSLMIVVLVSFLWSYGLSLVKITHSFNTHYEFDTLVTGIRV